MFEKEAAKVEERAEQYVINNTDESVNSFNGEQFQKAYIAGAKENGVKWHKVADGDLPKEEDLEMQVLCLTMEGYQLLSLSSDPKPIFDYYKVIAWCEIPTFTE